MVGGITNFLTNPTLSNIAQSTTMSVSIETGMKAIGRPSFILMDKKVDKQTRNYAAMKEFLYQLICLGVYMAVVIPVFKNGAFKIAKKYIYKGTKGFSKFKNAAEYLDYRKCVEKTLASRQAYLGQDSFVSKFNHDGLREVLLTKEKPRPYHHVKGAIELGNIVGCVVGLAILSPKISQAITRGFLKLTGLEQNPNNKN